MGIKLVIHVRVSGPMQQRILAHPEVKNATFADIIEVELNDDMKINDARRISDELRASLIEIVETETKTELV
jgi:hypothetical protein